MLMKVRINSIPATFSSCFRYDTCQRELDVGVVSRDHSCRMDFVVISCGADTMRVCSNSSTWSRKTLVASGLKFCSAVDSVDDALCFEQNLPSFVHEEEERA